MLYDNRTSPLALLLIGLALAGATAPAEGAGRKPARGDGGKIVVTCTSGIAWDIGPCTAQAIGRCKGRAQLLGSAVEYLSGRQQAPPDFGLIQMHGQLTDL